MSRLFDISSDFEELFDQFEAIDEMEFDTDENGNPVDANGNIVNPEVVKADFRQAWFDTLDGMEQEFNLKAENTAQFIKCLQAKQDAMDAEVKRLQQRSKSCKNKIAWLKQYLMTCMEQMRLKKVDGVRARITIRNNQPSLKIANELELIQQLQAMERDDLLKYSLPEIRKADLKKLVKNGEQFDGVTLESSKSILIA